MIKSCSKREFKITRYFHIFSIMVIVAGTSYNMYAAANKKETGITLPLALASMIILRLPNQICVAKNEKDGWLSVTGSVLGLISYIATVIIILHFQNKKGNGSPSPSPSPFGGDSVQVTATLEKPKKKEKKKYQNKYTNSIKSFIIFITFIIKFI